MSVSMEVQSEALQPGRKAAPGLTAAFAVAAVASFVTLLLLVFALLLILGTPKARAGELVPSIGLTRSVEGDDAKPQVGIALRGWLLPGALQTEIGVGYRREEYYGGNVSAKMIPVTASLLLRPIPTLHADAGVGWYNTRLDYDDPLLANETSQAFGVHLGGGVQVPLAPTAALDLTGRYVLMEDQESKLIPNTFDPDFWTMSLGLAIRF